MDRLSLNKQRASTFCTGMIRLVINELEDGTALDSDEEAEAGSDLDQEDTDLVTPVLSTDDLNVQQTEESFVTDGCGCKQACHLKFDSQEILGVRHTFLELPQLDRNQLIMFAIQSFCQTPQTST